MNKVGSQDQRRGFFYREGPQKAHRPKTYVPHFDAPIREWSGPIGKIAVEKGKWKKIEVGGASFYLDNSQNSKKHSYVSKNYMVKKPNDSHPMDEASKELDGCL